MNDNKTRIHYAWVTLAACFMFSFTTMPCLQRSGLYKAAVRAFDSQRAPVSVYAALINVGQIIGSPIMGSLIQRKSHKRIILICSLVAAAAFFGYSLCMELWQFYLISLVLGVCTAGLTSASVSALISRWFSEKRALALGIAYAGSGVGSAIFNPVVNWYINGFGWRAGFRMLAVVLLCINIPLTKFVIINSPADRGMQPYGARPAAVTGMRNGGAGFTRAETVRMPIFWLFLLASLLSGMTGCGVLQQLSAYMTDRGYDSAFAALIISGIMLFAAIGKPLSGWVFDRFGPRAGVLFLGLPMSVGIALLPAIQLPAVPYLVMCFYGVGYSLLTVPAAVLTLQLFGQKEYSAIFGIVMVFLGSGAALGSPVLALAFDIVGSYSPVWGAYSAAALAYVLIMLFVIGKMRKPA
jgi:MFS family permease